MKYVSGSVVSGKVTVDIWSFTNTKCPSFTRIPSMSRFGLYPVRFSIVSVVTKSTYNRLVI